MREYRSFLARFALYDKTGICKFLEKKAANGWMLDEMGALFWKFKRIEPQKLKFSVVYLDKASEYDPRPTESQLRLQEYCEYAGWEFVTSRGEILVYYSENENAVPIETDAVVEVKSVHSVMWRSWLLPYMLLTFSQGLRLYSYSGRFVQDPVTSLLTGWVTLIVIEVVSILFCFSEAVEYIVWYVRAKRLAKLTGTFLSTKNHSNIKAMFLLIIIFATLLASSFLSENLSDIIILLLVILYVTVVIFFRQRTITFLKRFNVPKVVNYLVTISVIVACVFAFSKIITEKISWQNNYHIENFMTDEEFRAAAPLELSDFIQGEIDVTISLVEEHKSESAFQFRAEQSANSPTSDEKYTLAYTVFDIKIPFVRRVCVNSWFERYFVFDNFLDRTGVSLDRISHREISAKVWSADEAYILCIDGQAINRYLLCYGNKIVEFIPSWTLTAEQVKVVAETFG
ncbi:MAG: DUF2812 domain-containing protein [Ruminiclostridium sp.]|nr:DUF2812 domain-containing protein [Ruminiclostridium sp.]